MVALLLAAGVILSSVAIHLGVSTRREPEIVLSTALLGLLVGYHKLRTLPRFWMFVAAFCAAHVFLFWLLFDVWFPEAKPIAFWVTLTVAIEAYSLQVLANRWRIKMIVDEKKRRASNLR